MPDPCFPRLQLHVQGLAVPEGQQRKGTESLEAGSQDPMCGFQQAQLADTQIETDPPMSRVLVGPLVRKNPHCPSCDRPSKNALVDLVVDTLVLEVVLDSTFLSPVARKANG